MIRFGPNFVYVTTAELRGEPPVRRLNRVAVIYLLRLNTDELWVMKLDALDTLLFMV